VFGFDPATGHTGLLAGKRAVVVYTSAVSHEGAPLAFARLSPRLLQRSTTGFGGPGSTR
jgi:hypothetical protein